jgi:hypothetical protein
MSAILSFIVDFVLKPLGLTIELNADAESNFLKKHPEVSTTFNQLNDAWNLRAVAPAVRQKLQAELIANFLGIKIQIILASDWSDERLKARNEGRKPKRVHAKEFFGDLDADSESVSLLEGIPVRDGSTPKSQYELFPIPKALTEVVTFPAVNFIEGGITCGFDVTIRHFLLSKDVAITKAFIDGKKLLLQYYESERVRREQKQSARVGNTKKRPNIHRKVGGADPSQTPTASAGGSTTDSDDDAKSFSDSLAASSIVQVFSKDVPVLKESNVNYEGFKTWVREFKQLDNKTGRIINPLTAIDEGSNTYFKALWETCDPPMFCPWETSTVNMPRDDWFREVEEMIRKAQNIPKITMANLDLKLVDGVPQVATWHINFSKYLREDESGISVDKQIDKLLRSIEVTIPSQAAIYRENLADWKAEISPQIFDAQALLSKVVRPLLLYSQACLESIARTKESNTNSDKESNGKSYHKNGGANPNHKHIHDRGKGKFKKDQEDKKQVLLGDIICFKCQQKGHKADKCPNKKRLIDEKDDKVPKINGDAKKHRFKKLRTHLRSIFHEFCDSCCDVRVGDKTFRALLDTGATNSHISPKLLEYASSCGMTVFETNKILYVETATGDRLPCNKQVDLSATLVIPSTIGLEMRPIRIKPFEFPMHDIDLVIGVNDIRATSLWDVLIAINTGGGRRAANTDSCGFATLTGGGGGAANSSSQTGGNGNS